MSLTKDDTIEDINKNCGFTKSKSAELTESLAKSIGIRVKVMAKNIAF